MMRLVLCFMAWRWWQCFTTWLQAPLRDHDDGNTSRSCCDMQLCSVARSSEISFVLVSRWSSTGPGERRHVSRLATLSDVRRTFKVEGGSAPAADAAAVPQASGLLHRPHHRRPVTTTYVQPASRSRARVLPLRHAAPRECHKTMARPTRQPHCAYH